MNKMSEQEAVEILNTFRPRQRTKNYNKLSLEDVKATEIVLNELEKKDKIIGAMTEYIEEINYIDIDNNECEFETRHQIECPDTSCKDCIKQYFERRAEDE